MPLNAFFPWNFDLLVSQKKHAKILFFHPPSLFPGNFCKCNSGGICTASQFLVQFPSLYTVWSNAYSEIGLEVTLRPLVTSCAKDYKGHSLVQTTFTELPNNYMSPNIMQHAMWHVHALIDWKAIVGKCWMVIGRHQQLRNHITGSIIITLL